MLTCGYIEDQFAPCSWTSLILSGAGNNEVNGEYNGRRTSIRTPCLTMNPWTALPILLVCGCRRMACVGLASKIVFCMGEIASGGNGWFYHGQGAVYAAHTAGLLDQPPKPQWEVSNWINDNGEGKVAGIAGAAPAPSCQVTCAASTCHCQPHTNCCLLYTSPSPRDLSTSRMPSSA